MRCPTCGRNLAGEDTCPRCATEVEVLHRLRESARAHLDRARSLLRSGRPEEAGEAFRAARALVASEDAAQGIAVCFLCRGRFREAVIDALARAVEPASAPRGENG